MLRDLIKTAAAVVVIGLIIIATFLYGKHQSNQQKEAAKPIQKQQSQPVASPANQSKQSPQPSSPAPVSQPSASSSSSAPSQPTADTTAQAMPQTGGQLSLLPLGFLIVSGLYYRSSRHQLQRALRAT